jgi:hypothetical protein
MQADIAIIVVAYNRPESLRRLLRSIELSDYGQFHDITLIISIDKSGNDDCGSIAKGFQWKYGEKEVIIHDIKLGLKKHIFSCGDMTADFDAVIVLEDDVLVSPIFYHYAQQAYQFYHNDVNIAGIALYRPSFNDVAYCPFDPIDDGFDSYFMKVPCSWGQLWTSKQWIRFLDYMNLESAKGHFNLLPKTVKLWPDESSWKKIFYSYLSAHDLYIVYPRIGLTTNFGDVGQHMAEELTVYQTPLLLSIKNFNFQSLEGSISVYDGFYELEGSVYRKWFDLDISVTFDLNGTKSLDTINTEYLISCRKCTRAIKQIAASCYPNECNVLLDIPYSGRSSSFFSFSKTSAFKNEHQFIRLNQDVKRIFMNEIFIRNAALTELRQSAEYRIGHTIMRPIQFIKKLIGVNTKNDKG